MGYKSGHSHIGQKKVGEWACILRGRRYTFVIANFHATRKEELAMFDTIIQTAGALLPGGDC